MRRARWAAKKLARGAVAAATWAAGALDGGAGVRVLTYHRFGTATRDPFCVTVDALERQMAFVAARGLAVGLADVEAFRAGRRRMPAGAVLVTVDDGYASLLRLALPVFRRHAIPVVAFVPPGFLGRDAAPEPYLGWAGLEALAAAGVAIGSHGWSHRSLARLARADAREEAERSRAVLSARLGAAVTAFAYPFGTHADFDAGTAAVLRAAGYTCAFTSQHGAVRAGSDPFALPRVKVEGGEPEWLFPLLVRGGLDAWGLVDRTLWRLQAVPG